MADTQRKLEIQQAPIMELDNIIKKLYEDNVTGKLSDERFIKLSGDYQTDQVQVQIKKPKQKQRKSE